MTFTVKLEQASQNSGPPQEQEHQQFGTDAEGLPLELGSPSESTSQQ